MDLNAVQAYDGWQIRDIRSLEVDTPGSEGIQNVRLRLGRPTKKTTMPSLSKKGD